MSTYANSHLLSDIITDVRVVLDQNESETGVLAANPDTLELDENIEQKIVHAARQILEIAPLNKIPVSVAARNQDYTNYIVGTQELTDDDNKVSTVEPQQLGRPDDFLRLMHAIVVEGDEEDATAVQSRELWQVALSTYQLTDSEAFMVANSAYSGIKPNAKRPALFYDIRLNKFFFYGCSYGHAVLTYIKLPQIVTEYEGTAVTPYLQFPDILYEALVYQTASLVEASYKNLPASQMFASLAMGYAGIQQQQEKDTKK